MSSFKLEPATRQGIIPLMGLWGGTGGGKTMSAIMLASGMARGGKVGVIDTEGRRASYYADTFKFSAINFDAPYTPERYIEAIDILEEACDVGVIDSASHCWEGPDGVLDLHEQTLDRMLGDKKDNYSERARLNWPAWRDPKFRFAKLRSRILKFKKPLIICFRGKIKSRMVKDTKGHNTVETDEHPTPIFDDSFIFEMHVAMEVFQKQGTGGYVWFPSPYAKTSHSGIRALLPAEGEQLTAEHGAKLMDWCTSPQGPGSAQTSQPASKPAAATGEDPRKVLCRELWKLSVNVRGSENNWTGYEIWSCGQGILTDTETVLAMTEDRLKEVIKQTKEKLPK